MAKQADFYVYMIFRPDGTPCYVGKGRGRRWTDNARRSHNPHLRRIIAKAEGNVPLVKIREGLTEPEAFEIECAFIAAIGRKDSGGPLVNLTEGGEGTADPSPETRAKQRAKKLGGKATEETKAKMRAAHALAPPRDPAWGAKISAAKMGHKQRPETIEKLRAWKRSPELCARIAAATKTAMNRPEVQAKLHAPRNLGEHL